MGNSISIRQGPELDFVIPEHRMAFEHKVITCYEKSLKEKDLRGFNVPHVEFDLFDYIQLSDPIHYVAARLNYNDPEDSFHEQHLKHLSYDAEFKFAVDQMKLFEDDVNHHRRGEADDLFYDDIVSVLNFHKMCFVDLGRVNEWGHWQQGNFYKNLPWGRQVW